MAVKKELAVVGDPLEKVQTPCCDRFIDLQSEADEANTRADLLQRKVERLNKQCDRLRKQCVLLVQERNSLLDNTQGDVLGAVSAYWQVIYSSMHRSYLRSESQARDAREELHRSKWQLSSAQRETKQYKAQLQVQCDKLIRAEANASGLSSSYSQMRQIWHKKEKGWQQEIMGLLTSLWSERMP